MKRLFGFFFLLFALTANAQINITGSPNGHVSFGSNVTAGVVSINGVGGVYTFTGSGVSCSSTTCTFTGAGVTSMNGLTGALSLVGDSSITVTPSGSNINLHATGTGGSGVQYNPTTTAYIVTSFSGLYDDGDANNSTALPALTSVTCSGTTCSVVFTAAHNLVVGGAVDLSNLTTWPGGVYQAAQKGSFQVSVVNSPTQVTLNNPLSISYTCSSSCGTAYDASSWAIWALAREPFIYGHGTVYGIETTTQNLALNFATLITGMTGTPTILIDQTGQNDLLAGRTYSQVIADHQTVWAAAHAAGMTVIQTTMINGSYGVSPVGIAPAQVNAQYWQYAKSITNRASGQYWDGYIDTASAQLSASGVPPAPYPNAGIPQIFADIVNEGLANQKSLLHAAPQLFQYNVNATGGYSVPTWFMGSRVFTYDNNWNLFKDTQSNGLSNTEIWYAQNGTPLHQMFLSSLGANSGWCATTLGQAASTNDSVQNCFYRVASGSASNYGFLKVYGGASDALHYYGDGSVVIPSIPTSTSPICPNGTNGALTTTGCVAAAGSPGLFSGLIHQPTTTTIGTAYNQSANFAASSINIPSGVLLKDFSVTTQLEGWLQAYPTPPFTLTWLISNVIPGGNFTQPAMFVASSTTGNVMAFEHGYDWQLEGVQTYSSPTTFVATISSNNLPFKLPYVWQRYQDDGTNITFSWSFDGYNFTTLYTVAKASSFLSASGFNYIGYGFSANTVNGAAVLMSWNITTP